MAEDNNSASDEEDSSVIPEDLDMESNDNDDNLSEEEGDDADLLIDSLYKSRSGVQWNELPKTLLQKQKAKNIIKHKAGAKVGVKSEVSECSIVLF